MSISNSSLIVPVDERAFSDDPDEEQVKNYFLREGYPRLAKPGEPVQPGTMELCTTCHKHRYHYHSGVYCYCDSCVECEDIVMPVQQKDGTEVCWWYAGAGQVMPFHERYGDQRRPGGVKRPGVAMGPALTRRTSPRDGNSHVLSNQLWSPTKK